MTQITTLSLADIKAMIARGEVKPPRDIVPECDMPEGFWDNAVLMPPMFDKDGNRIMTAAQHDAMLGADKAGK